MGNMWSDVDVCGVVVSRCGVIECVDGVGIIYIKSW